MEPPLAGCIFDDDAAWLRRLIVMMKLIVSVLVAAAAGCAADVNLPLDLQRGGAGHPIGWPAWSRADFPHQGYVHEVAWAADGGLLASVPMRTTGSSADHISVLTRHEADGTLDWNVELTGYEYFGPLSATDDGGAVVAIESENYESSGLDGLSALAWYDRDGNQTAIWRAGPHLTRGLLHGITAVRALPDGSVFWAGEVWSPASGC